MSERRARGGLRLDGAAGALWASAMVILALVVIQAGGALSPGREAHAQAVSIAGDLTVINAASSEDEEILIVIDSGRDRMSVYGVSGRRQVDLLQTLELPRLFSEARQAAGMQPRP